MAYEQRENSGLLARNKRRRPNSRDPEFTGTLNVEGVEYFINAWVKEGQYGKFFSISIKRKGAPAHHQEEHR
jgi:hypothetical protein